MSLAGRCHVLGGHAASGISWLKEVSMATLTQPTTQAPITLRNSQWEPDTYLRCKLTSWVGRVGCIKLKSKLAKRKLAKLVQASRQQCDGEDHKIIPAKAPGAPHMS